MATTIATYNLLTAGNKVCYGWHVMKEKRQTKMGRPPSGRDEEGKPMLVSQNYPKTTIYVEPKLKAKVQALGTIQNRAAWRIIEEALERYLSELPAKDREAIELLASRVRGTGGKKN